MYDNVGGTLLEACLQHDVFNPYLPFDQMLMRHQGLLVDFTTMEHLALKARQLDVAQLIWPIDEDSTVVCYDHAQWQQLSEEDKLRILSELEELVRDEGREELGRQPLPLQLQVRSLLQTILFLLNVADGQ